MNSYALRIISIRNEMESVMLQPTLNAKNVEKASHSFKLYGRNIDDEMDSMGNNNKKKGKKSKRKKGKITNTKATATVSDSGGSGSSRSDSNSGSDKSSNKNSDSDSDSDSDNSSSNNNNSQTTTVVAAAADDDDDSVAEEMKSEDDRVNDKQIMKEQPAGLEANRGPITVPKSDPLKQNKVPPEVVFFGEPRNPPPIEAAGDVGYHGSLLYWARHANAVPRTSMERLDMVIPKGRRHPRATKYRMEVDNSNLSFQTILKSFKDTMDDLEASKDFIASNIDTIPPVLFQRAITAAKLSAQSKNDLKLMEEYKVMRRRYTIASDQVFFPMNIEIQKSETRVMTYLARSELRNFAKVWDEVEMTLHFTTLLAARLTWDERVQDVLRDIKEKVDTTVGYMASGIQRQLMGREFRKPGITSEIYKNATEMIADTMPELYKKVNPEVKLIYEAYNMKDETKIRDFVTNDFCPRNDVSLPELKEKLRIYENCLGTIQGVNYVNLRLVTRTVLDIISTEDEKRGYELWYRKFYENGGFDFETYEPDEIPTIIRTEQRMRETGNAFKDFAVQVLKAPTFYTNAFSGSRKKASEVGNWFMRDEEILSREPESYEERVEEFRKAYIEQSRLRMEADDKLDAAINGKLDDQDSAVRGSRVIEVSDE